MPAQAQQDTDTTEEPTQAPLAQKIEDADSKGEDSHTRIRRLLDAQADQFAIALRRGDGELIMDPSKFTRVALTAVRMNPTLAEASWASLAGALMGCAQLGLEPSGPLGQAWLVPFRDNKTGLIEVQLIIGYKGFVELAYRSGRVMSFVARPVHETDSFDFEYGSGGFLHHKPDIRAEDAGPTIASYAYVKLAGGGEIPEVLSLAQIESHRRMAKTDKIWKKWYDPMAAKTAAREVFKWVPSSVETQAALGADGSVPRGVPHSIEDLSDPEIMEPEDDVIDVEGEEI